MQPLELQATYCFVKTLKNGSTGKFLHLLDLVLPQKPLLKHAHHSTYQALNADLRSIICIIPSSIFETGGGFILACEDLGENVLPFINRLHFFLLSVEISLRTLIRLFMPGSANSGSVS